MTWLEIAGCIAIVLYFWEVYKKNNPERFLVDPDMHRRKYEFVQMSNVFGRLHELRDKRTEPHNENISNVQSAIDLLIQCTVPMPKESFASDYRSRRVDYLVIENLASSIITSEVTGNKVSVPEVKLD